MPRAPQGCVPLHADLRGALERLADAGLAARTGEPPRASSLFKHPLVQDAADGTLLLAKRRDLHAGIARALERRPSEGAAARPELLARHFALAGMADEAVAHFAEAGKRAIGRSAASEAATHLREALELLPALPDAPARWRRELDLQTALGAALVAADGYAAPEAGRVHERARALCERIGDIPRLIRAAGGQWGYHLVRAEIGRALGTAEDLLRVAEREDSPEARLAAHRLVGVGLLQGGRLREARRPSTTAPSCRKAGRAAASTAWPCSTPPMSGSGTRRGPRAAPTAGSTPCSRNTSRQSTCVSCAGCGSATSSGSPDGARPIRGRPVMLHSGRRGGDWARSSGAGDRRVERPRLRHAERAHARAVAQDREV